jgi:hypothetical protein
MIMFKVLVHILLKVFKKYEKFPDGALYTVNK